MAVRLFRRVAVVITTTMLCTVGGTRADDGNAVDFAREVQPVLTKYCAGCHNDQDQEGKLSLQGFSQIMQGGEHGPVIMPGDSGQSRMWQLVSGAKDPVMPPQDEAQPSSAELQLIRRWIDEGARSATALPAASLAKNPLETASRAKSSPSLAPKPITAMAWTADGKMIAIGRYGHVDLQTPEGAFVERIGDLPGKVNSLNFSRDGRHLVIATGVAGVSGQARMWDLAGSRAVRDFGQHSDVLYAAVSSPDGRWVATAGYDRKIHIWDRETGERKRSLEGHHGAVYDLVFSPNSQLLASASADSTVKIWQVETGLRLDTLSQPLKEQLSVDISPDGQYVLAAGADNRLRLWRLVSQQQPEINPLLVARYGHEQPIQRVRFSPDGKYVMSVAADKTLKVWDADQLDLVATYPQESDVAQAFVVDPQGRHVLVGRMDGGMQRYDLTSLALARSSDVASAVQDAEFEAIAEASAREMPIEINEVEPNDRPDQAQRIELPATISGRIFDDNAAEKTSSDRDSFRFSARAGQVWLIDVQAARKGSPLDSIVRVVDSSGKPIVRVLLQAIRDSYFTFRGKDSSQTGDFRLHNWEEMRLNQYLYASGEVVKLFHYPRGPDSGFNVYPNSGSRYGYFDTTAISHALNEPAYIVEPHPPTAVLPANGLPVFPIYYENDDESRRRAGVDSLLTFSVPEDGEYIVEIEDARQAQGEAFQYQLQVRPPRPEFTANISTKELSVPKGAGQPFEIHVERQDGFEGPIRIDIDALPAGWIVTSPLIVEPGHLRAKGTVFATADLPEATAETPAIEAKVYASANLTGEQTRREIGKLGPLRVVSAPPITIELQGATDERTSEGVAVLPLQAGQTGVIRAKIDRNNFAERVSFGSEEALQNAPHGVFVANTGLNGVLITESESAREVFIHVEPWVEPGDRLVYIQAEVNGKPTSAPAVLRIHR